MELGNFEFLYVRVLYFSLDLVVLGFGLKDLLLEVFVLFLEGNGEAVLDRGRS